MLAAKGTATFSSRVQQTSGHRRSYLSSHVKVYRPMHLWNTSRLTDELRDKSISETDSVKYMLVGSGLYAFTVYSAGWFGGDRHWSVLLESMLVAVVALWGTYACFRANGGVTGEDFVRRFATLSVPVGLKLAALSIVAALTMYFGAPLVLSQAPFGDPELAYRLLWLVVNLGLTYAFYWRLVYHIARAASPP